MLINRHHRGGKVQLRCHVVHALAGGRGGSRRGGRSRCSCRCRRGDGRRRGCGCGGGLRLEVLVPYPGSQPGQAAQDRGQLCPADLGIAVKAAVLVPLGNTRPIPTVHHVPIGVGLPQVGHAAVGHAVDGLLFALGYRPVHQIRHLEPGSAVSHGGQGHLGGCKQPVLQAVGIGPLIPGPVGGGHGLTAALGVEPGSEGDHLSHAHDARGVELAASHTFHQPGLDRRIDVFRIPGRSGHVGKGAGLRLRGGGGGWSGSQGRCRRRAGRGAWGRRGLRLSCSQRVGGDAGGVQGVEGGHGAFRHIPHHAVPVGDGLAVGQRGGGSLDPVSGNAAGVIGDIVQDLAALVVPQQIAALQPGGSQNGGIAAGGVVQLVLLSLPGGLVHVLEVHIPVAASAHAVVVEGHDVAVGGLLQAAHRGAGGIVPDAPGKGLKVHIPAPVVAAAGEFAGGGVGVVAHHHRASGVGVPVVQSQDLPVLIYQNKLVEGVADIAQADVHDIVEGVGDGHIALAHRHGQVGLMVEAVTAGIHLMAGADVQVIAILVAPQGAGVKGDCGVGPLQAGRPQAVPVFVVLHHPDDLGTVALGGIALAEYQEIVAFPGKEAAPDGQLGLDGAAVQEGKGGVVVFHHHLAAGVLHPGETAALILVEVGGHRTAPSAVILFVDVAALCRPASRRQGGGEQGENQGPGAEDRARPLQAVGLLHAHPYFLSLHIVRPIWKRARRTKKVRLALLVEAGGVEPPSENASAGTSPGADGHLHSLTLA